VFSHTIKVDKIRLTIRHRFLLAQLHIDSLRDKTTPKQIREALEKLPKGSEALVDAYKGAVERIEDQERGLLKLAKQVLSWITCAKRPLTTLEIRHALAVEIGGSKLDEENLPEIEDMVSVCAGLVTVDEESNIIRLVHYTAQEYFERTWTSWFPSAQTDITKTCVTYLSFRSFEAGFCPTNKEFESRDQLNPFYVYAARNWGHHAGAASTEVLGLILDFLGNEAKVASSSQAMMISSKDYSQAMMISSKDYSQKVPRKMTGVHLATHFGLGGVIMTLVEMGNDPDARDTYGRTPLSYAAENGHDEVVKLLLAMDSVNPDFKNMDGRTPLLFAAENGHTAVVKLLVVTDAVNPDSSDTDGRTPLSWAAEKGHEAVVQHLLATGRANPDLKDSRWYRTSLSFAAGNGHEAIVKLLLATDAVNPNSKDTWGRTPLSFAAENGHEAMMKLLLATDGVDPDCKDKNGWTPLSYATRKGHETVMNLLLENDVNADSEDKFGRTPLSWAAENGYKTAAKLLLEKGANPDRKDKCGRTPLSWAAEKRHEMVIELLLEKGVDQDSKDSLAGWTPVLWYVKPEAVAKLLAMNDN